MSWGWGDFFALLALVFVLEGIYPAISPSAWRRMLLKFASAKDSAIRSMGLSLMIAGAVMLAVVHNIDAVGSMFG